MNRDVKHSAFMLEDDEEEFKTAFDMAVNNTLEYHFSVTARCQIG